MVDTRIEFDPTSPANVTASAIIVLGVICIVSGCYTAGKFRGEDQYKYNSSLMIFFSAVALILWGLSILFSYD